MLRGLAPGRYRLGIRYEPAPQGTPSTGQLQFGPSVTEESARVGVEAGADDVALPMPFHVDFGDAARK